MTPLCFAAGPDRWTDPTETSSYRSFEKDGWKAFGNFLSPGISIETFQTAQHPVFRLEAWVQCSPYSPQQKLFIWRKHPQVFCSLGNMCFRDSSWRSWPTSCWLPAHINGMKIIHWFYWFGLNFIGFRASVTFRGVYSSFLLPFPLNHRVCGGGFPGKRSSRRPAAPNTGTAPKKKKISSQPPTDPGALIPAIDRIDLFAYRQKLLLKFTSGTAAASLPPGDPAAASPDRPPATFISRPPRRPCVSSRCD